MTHAYIGFGSNIGDRFAHTDLALRQLLQRDGISLIQVSSLYETEPVGYIEQDWFLNGVVAVATDLLPHQLLNQLKQIEKRVGRRHRIRWGPREIDLDLLIYSQCLINTPDLVVPHPQMHRRSFVLAPFAEIAPDVIHPILRQRIDKLLAAITDQNVVKPVAPPPL